MSAQTAPNVASDTWPATDALGRTFPMGGDIRAPQKDKFVGILLQGTVPRALVQINTPEKTAFDFHWLDNMALGGDPTDW